MSDDAARRTVGGRRSLRGYAAVLLLGLAGAVAVMVAVTRPWIRGTAEVPGLPTIEAEVSGTTMAPLAGALGVVLLASFGAVIATRGWVRRGLGVLVVVASVVVLVSAAAPPDAADALEDALSAKGWAGGDYTSAPVGWRWLALVGAIGCLVAGAAVAVRGHRWAVMGSRYDAPVAPRAAAQRDADQEIDDAELWRALDQGRDPTRDA
jgi:uncharacterized membrane protein (TIGR02234 family)